MANIGRITFEDKVDYRQEGQDDRFKITANDINQLKEVFNNSAETIEKNVEDTEALQTKLENAIAKTGTYKLENGKVYFMKSDGTYGEGIELPAQSSVFLDNIVQGTINMNTTRSSSANKVSVQILDINGNAVMVETTASQVYTQDGLTLESLLNNALFVLEDSDGITHCGDYERYIKFLADQQKTKDENKEATV